MVGKKIFDINITIAAAKKEKAHQLRKFIKSEILVIPMIQDERIIKIHADLSYNEEKRLCTSCKNFLIQILTSSNDGIILNP